MCHNTVGRPSPIGRMYGLNPCTLRDCLYVYTMKDCLTTFRDDMGNRPVTSGDWTAYELGAPIAIDAFRMWFGIQLTGHDAA
jgi:hypothetical protein